MQEKFAPVLDAIRKSAAFLVRYKKFIAFPIKAAVTTALFLLLFWPELFGLPADTFGAITPGKLLDEIREVEPQHIAFWLLFATVVKLAGMLAGVLRWRLLLKGQGIRIPFWYMVQSWFVGRTIGIFLPGTIGLDGYRLYDSARYTGEVIKCTTVIAVEKLIGVIALTLLVFLTFPLGFGLLQSHVPNFSIPMLVICMTAFGGLVLVSFLTLLNPRLIQIIVGLIPTPAFLRNKFNKLGAAATAYSANRSTLLWAVLFGILVHVGTCMMYFGTMSAIRAENTTIFDIFFTSPLMIWGTVLGPTVGGEGIREIVFVVLLSAKSSSVKAFLIAHLGWWVGELVPFLIGLPIFLFRSRPSKQELSAEMASARQTAANAKGPVMIPPEEVRAYRDRLINCGIAGALAGLIAGGLVGLGEGSWFWRNLAGLSELAVFWWAPLAYALPFVGIGLGVAAGLAFLYLLVDRFPKPTTTFALALGAAGGAGALIVGWWRFKRDILEKHSPSLSQNLVIVLAAATFGLILLALAWFLLSRRQGTRKKAVTVGLATYAVIVIEGAIAAWLLGGPPPTHAPNAAAHATGPNIVLVAIDALRADYLPMYADNAVAKTPHLDAFRQDCALFENGFAQASWTKASFATMFSGRYPRSHTATSLTAALPDEVVTFPEILHAGGYYTKGFSNNPNITAAYSFHQGFSDYVDLKPSLHFGAPDSASSSVAYQVLRRVREKFPWHKAEVTDAYQPAEVVTEVGLEWLAGDGAPKDRPFFLFLHYMDPHDPYMDHKNPGVAYARVGIEHPDPDTFLGPMRDAYVQEIEHLDKHLGTLFRGLRDLGLYDDTVIVFTADHGEEFYDHRGWWHGQTLYDEQVHIPLLVKLPGNASSGSVHSEFARHIDLAPTILHLAGTTPDPAMSGGPLLEPDGTPPAIHPEYVYAEEDFEGNVLESVRSYDAKIIHANEDNPRGLDPVELYALDSDPLELDNLAGKEDERETALNALLTDMQAFIENGAAEPQFMLGDLEALERVRDIGYGGDDDLE